MHADQRRNGQTARDDGGVRGGAAEVGHERGDALRLELYGVGGRQVVRDHDAVGIATACVLSRPRLPASALSTRSTTCTTSALRLRR
jgi:hypothetical protein